MIIIILFELRLHSIIFSVVTRYYMYKYKCALRAIRIIRLFAMQFKTSNYTSLWMFRTTVLDLANAMFR